MNTFVFKVSAYTILAVFVIFISDLRKKPKMVPITNETLVKIMKLSYLIPLILYGYNLYIIDNLLNLDWLGLVITLTGSFCVIKAKTDLGRYHTWTGYRLESTALVTNGIYSYIRHPLYTGIFLFAIGGNMILFLHAHLLHTTIVILTLSYILFFLAKVAKIEEEHLHKEFKKSFEHYKQTVHPFLPLRKFIGQKD